MMGMVFGHIFNHVTKKVPAWETRQCFSNPAGCLCLTCHRFAQPVFTTWDKKSDFLFFFPSNPKPSLITAKSLMGKAVQNEEKYIYIFQLPFEQLSWQTFFFNDC